MDENQTDLRPGPHWQRWTWKTPDRHFWVAPDHSDCLEALPDGSFKRFDLGVVLLKGFRVEGSQT